MRTSVSVREQASVTASSRSGNRAAAQATINRILRRGPDEPNALRLRALLRAQDGEFADDQMLGTRPRNSTRVSASGGDLAMIWQRRADLLFGSGEDDAARLAPRRSVSCDPCFTDMQRAVQAAASGRPQDAESVYRRILKVDPNHMRLSSLPTSIRN